MTLPVKVGDTTRFAKTVGETDVYLFAGISGDFGANHVNQAHMESTPFGGRIAHGALMIAFISAASTALCERTPLDSRLVPVNLGFDRVRFIKAVHIGDTVEVTYRVAEVDAEKRRAICHAHIHNQRGDLVAVAENVLKWVAA